MTARRIILGGSVFGGGYCIIDFGLNYIRSNASKDDLPVDLSGKAYIVTGATSGIGQAAAEELAKRNARVIMACRNREKCVDMRREIVLNTKNKLVYCRQCDLSDFDSIVSFASKLYKGKYEVDRIDGIVHNAAVMEPERKVNKDGIESTLATNHLGAFLMTGLLLEKLQAQSNPVRLVFVNTDLISKKTALNFANLNEELRPKEPSSDEEKSRPTKWDNHEVYKRSKLAEAMFAKDLAEKLKNTNITVTMVDPGRTKSNLWANEGFLTSLFVRGRSPSEAARPVLYAVAGPEMEGQTGVFIDHDRKEQDWGEGVADDEARSKLWAVSERWTRFPDRLSALYRSFDGGEGEKVEAVEAKPGRSWRTLWLW